MEGKGMKPVLIRISQKTIEPSPSPKHEYRICFRFKYKIDYNMSEYFFKEIGNPDYGLQIDTDAQFAKWLVDNFGLGKYLVLVWKKGREGFSHYYFDCENTHKFKQIRKKRTADEEEKEKVLREIKKKKKEINETASIIEKEEIRKEVEGLKEDMGFTNEMIEMDRDIQTNKIKVFKNTQILYKEHEYENYGNENDELYGKYDSSIW